MKNLFLDEEIYLENYFKDKIRKDIYIPDAFLDDINQYISIAPTKNRFAIKIAATCIAIILVFFLSIYSFPAINTFAQNVPILKNIVQLFINDAGIKNANEHGYLSSKDIIVEKYGYTIKIENVTFDNERLTLMATISKPSNPIVYDVDIDLPDFDNNRNISINVAGDLDRNVSLKIEKFFYKDELSNFLSKKQNFIMLNILLFYPKENNTSDRVYDTDRYMRFNKENDTILQEIKDINIPINISIVENTTTYIINKDIALNGLKSYCISFKLKELKVNPTRMRLCYESYEKDRYILSGFDSPILKDNEGHIYRQAADIITQEKDIVFVPSLYFDKTPEILFFCMDGVNIYDKDNKKNIKIKLKEEIPLNIKTN